MSVAVRLQRLFPRARARGSIEAPFISALAASTREGFRAHVRAAPLKRKGRVRVLDENGKFPRARARGSIEANFLP